jgi:protein-tyrosine phosphatase
MSDNGITLGDPAIAEIARLLQLAILSGTDVTDHLRTFRLVIEDGIAYPHPDFIENLEEAINKMAQEATRLSAERA